ncbi:leucyl/phenylalanyl-tRNA--protein transferase [Moraxella sp. ZJ142]|uniref:leucyl/phenylalanyl-tRNA--protein transferase n=1 Tax=Moraxella marmotae TaxID=3344520 RepID=UPI0035D4C5F2
MDTLTQLHALADTCPYDFRAAARSSDHDGFLGTGGDLDAASLLHAYRSGVFPWFGHDEPICWWSPKSRCVLPPADFYPSKSLIRTAKKQPWRISTNLAFAAVIDACSQPRRDTSETWIHDSMKAAYQQLHKLGVAVSVEVWAGQPLHSELIGGLYGVNFGAIFCGESMFHRQTDASKIAFWALMHLAKHSGIALIDCQLENPHLMSLGAKIIDKDEFLTILDTLVTTPCTGLNHQMHLINCQDLLDGL